MTRQIKLHAEERKEKGGKKILTEGFIPAVIYGPGREPENLKLKKLDFERVFSLAGESNLINLAVGEKEAVKVIIKDAQKDVLKDRITHVDFYQVDMKKKITTEIPLHFTGESKAVKELGGILVKGADRIEITCLPGDLVDHIDVDLTSLKTFHDFIRIKDLKLPAGIELTSETDEVLVHVVEPKAEEEIPAVAAPTEEPAAAPTEGEEKKEEKGEKK